MLKWQSFWEQLTKDKFYLHSEYPDDFHNVLYSFQYIFTQLGETHFLKVYSPLRISVYS